MRNFHPSHPLGTVCRILLLALTVLSLASSNLFAQRLDVLIIGSTKSYSDAGPAGLDYAGMAQEKAFNPTTIATRLQSILSQDTAVTDVTPTVNVVFEDIYKTARMNVPIGSPASSWDMEFRCFSLAQHFMWPDGKAARMTNLRGAGTYQWDYIVLVEDPYVMARFPGMYAEGVKLIQSEVAQSANPAQIILLGQWPENSSSFTAAQFNEIVHRVGDSAGIPVAPGAKAWASYTSQDTDSAHPTPRGQYLAACAIYSKMFARTAKSSGYYYPSNSQKSIGQAIADHVWGEVQSAAATTQYAGKYTAENAFQMSYVQERACEWNKYGSSTEQGFSNGVVAALESAKVTSTVRSGSASNPLDLAYSRGTDAFEDTKQYNYGTRLDNADRNHGFPMGDHSGTAETQPGALTMRYGIDKRYYGAYWFYNGTDLGVAHSMVCEDEVPLNVRGIPVRLLWSKMEHANLGLTSHRDSWHLSNELDRAVGSYLYTLLSGRCPVEAEPTDNTSTAWKQWWCRKMGYETAWQMAHLTTRAPGFRVCPSSATALTLAPGATETMTVEFINPPQSDVTVTVGLSGTTAAIVGPKTLTFTPANYSTPQQVIVAAIPGASASEAFAVTFTTSSDDDCYDGLGDRWTYTTTRSSTVSVTQTDNGTDSVIALQNTPLAINLNTTGSNGTNTILVGPFHGTANWSSDSVVQYTPQTDYLGSDLIVYCSTVGGVQTYGCIEITVEVPNGQVNVVAGDASASETGPNTGTFVINRLGGDTGSALNVYFTMGGSATIGDDYTLSHTSPVIIPINQESVTITLTPVDDSVFGERDESAVLTITEDPGYPIGAASAVVTIADNDNTAPTANAGADQDLEFTEVTMVPGLTYGTVAGNIDTTTPNPGTQILVNPSTQTENSIAVDTTEIYTGRIYDADGQISFTERIDDKAWIEIDGVVVIDDGAYNNRTSTLNLDLADNPDLPPGWHNIEIRISNGTGGSGPVGGEIGIGYDPTGGTTWQVLTDPGDGSFLRTAQGVAGGQTTMAGDGGDVDGDLLSYSWSVVSKPDGSTVTFGDETAPDSSAHFSAVGTYVLRLTVSDGLLQDTDDVTINVQLLSNTPPVTDAGADQTVYLVAGGSWTPGITYVPITGDEDCGISSDKIYTHAIDFGADTTRALINGVQFQAGGTTFGDKAGTSATIGTGSTSIAAAHAGNTAANPYLNGGSACAMEDLVKDMNYNDSTGVITLTGLTPGMHYQFKLYNRVWSGTRVQNIGFDIDETGTGIAGAEFTGTFDEDNATLYDPGFATSTQVYALTFDYALPSGVTSLNVYIDTANGGTYHLYGLTNEQVSAAGASVSLNGTVTDGEQTPSGSWSVFSGNTDAVSFANADAIDTTATFTAAGTYVLQLTGDDGYEQTTDTVTIIVNPPLPTIYATWAGTFGQAFNDIDPTHNGDSDRKGNMMEFALGTDPTVSDDGVLAVDGSAHGEPIALMGAGDAMEFYFIRRKDYGTSGSVSYTVQFSTDLSEFTDNDDEMNPLFKVIDSGVDGDNYEVMKVAYPSGAQFGRVKINFVP